MQVVNILPENADLKLVRNLILGTLAGDFFVNLIANTFTEGSELRLIQAFDLLQLRFDHS